MLDQIPGSVERVVIVENPSPVGRQSRQPAPRTTVRTAHFEIALESHLWEDCGDVVRPVGDRCALARQARESSLHQVAERLAGDVDIVLAALDEIHRYPEGIVDVTLEAHTRLECPR